MKKISGKVVFRDLEGGVWELVGDDGARYALHGGRFQDGERVTVEGDVAQDMLGIGMTGAPALKVKKVSR